MAKRKIMFGLVCVVVGLAVCARADSYQIMLNLDINKGQLDGRMTLHYGNPGKEALENIRLRLDMNLDSSASIKILSVQDDNGVELEWRYQPFKFAKQQSEKGQMCVVLPKHLKSGDSTALKIHFKVDYKRIITEEMTVLQDDPFQSFDAWYPKAMTKKAGKWSFNDDRPSNYDVTIEVPVGLTIASTGKLIEEKPAGKGRRILHLKAERVRGFTIYGSSRWKKHSRNSEGIELNIYLPDEAKDWVKPMLDATADVIAFCRKEYGDFPTQHLDIVGIGSLTDEAHGASAACNIIGIFLSKRLQNQYHWLIAHEVPHQYFGSSIGLHADSVGWTIIGLAMVMERHYMVDRGLDGPKRPIGQWAYFEAEKRGYDTTLSQPLEGLLTAEAPWSFGWNMALRHGKAYAVCSMLEDLLGQEKFKSVIKKIITERAGTLISGGDLINYCEKALGEPLDWFAADWVNGNATLDYAVSDVKQMDGGWEVVITRVGTAGFPVIVEVETETGEKLRQRIDRQKEGNRLHFGTDDELKGVVIDPDTIYPDLNRSNNSWQKKTLR